jgi:hypothetical protein
LPTEPHSEFLELCAVSTSGELTAEEHKRLQEHLLVCAACREVLQQYETVVNKAIPAIAAAETSEQCELDSGLSSSEKDAEKTFFKRLEQERGAHDKGSGNGTAIFPNPHRLPPFSSESTWRHVWMLYGVGILLFVTLSFYAYRIGIHRGVESAKLAPPQSTVQTEPTLEAQLSDAGHERQMARVQIEQRDKTIKELRQQLGQSLAEIKELRAAKDRLENDLRVGDATRQDVAQKLDTAQSNSQWLQQKLDSLEQQSIQDSAHAKALDAKVNELTRLLREREVALNEKDELLAHDRDIRELMGARDLYIAEVHDVARDGKTQIPYGRVFYTKGKSLIFYAYDLDRQAGLKRASSFQAWGRRGPDREQALDLGVFYEDSASKKRWILKCDNPKTLEQIDAVFVTVEPNGGSHKPTGKSLLFASLKIEPNHP